jgi:MT-A70
MSRMIGSTLAADCAACARSARTLRTTRRRCFGRLDPNNPFGIGIPYTELFSPWQSPPETATVQTNARPRCLSGRAPRRVHSRKPHEAIARIERFCPGPRVELFAREQREGWDSLGDELGMFNDPDFGADPTTSWTHDPTGAAAADAFENHGGLQ